MPGFHLHPALRLAQQHHQGQEQHDDLRSLHVGLRLRELRLALSSSSTASVSPAFTCWFSVKSTCATVPPVRADTATTSPSTCALSVLSAKRCVHQ
ncbi:Hypothetical protein CAP_2357 [Chondromyces apiculatus DSM 436]|uniref:Uncharacterized protein n=1 Tax=Chondromyces apiculatus DSM 436 TaxID=1192034 RepID=A0A017TB77_9BACT|nr:Hypothetical protein CAP_2357 [Chondromyces apiculatus DSM 436]